MYEKIGRHLLRYLVFVGLPYFVATQIEDFWLDRLDLATKRRLNKDLKRFPEVDNISEETRNGLDNRGGEGFFILWVTKVIILDFGLKAAIGGGIFSTIWSSTADNAAANVAKFSVAIIQSPGPKLKNLYKKLKGIDPNHTQDIREILLDKSLSLEDKFHLLEIKVEQALKTLKGPKRTQFILFVMASLLFFCGGPLTGNFAVFAALMERLRAFLGTDGEADLRGALIDVYHEYNAPLPEELAKAIEKITE